MRRAAVICFALLATQAQGYSCIFETECYKDETGIHDNGHGSVTMTRRLNTVVATSKGAEHMLSLRPIGPPLKDGAQGFLYSGRCEGVF